MLGNGNDWSSLLRTISHGCGPIRGGVMLTFMAFLALPAFLYAALSDRHAAAGPLDRLACAVHVPHLLDGRLLCRFDVAVVDRVLDRPLRALRIHALVDRPHAVPGQLAY